VARRAAIACLLLSFAVAMWGASQDDKHSAPDGESAGSPATVTATSTAPSSATAAKPFATKPAATKPVRDAAAERADGEKRFHANCGRCHPAPQKFPPRVMATIVRHMRVRATITDEDTRLILEFMTQ